MRNHNTGSTSIDLTRIYEQTSDFKPRGLWYDFDNDWIDFVTRNQFNWLSKNNYHIEVDQSRILVLDSDKDVATFTEKYIKDTNGVYFFIDWSKVAEDYSGIEMPNYNKLRHFHGLEMVMKLLWIRSWDVKSGCIWDLSAIKKVTKL